ncbi:hypothetical protein SAMN05216490_3498 [Mucilaginibacter mallensis]|uniref:Surface glycan-binding protein B xyloglucan binding domain-containing protein n=1 Tax=Mucilaginibacter mallensis TaxID=652787 RepID=A0A1H2AED9_MUCMA|nr:glycan-binding surface protein [Mucilaginibacter mallensis]SDT44284.1 hypothetical protein SAMN05216490_3498 [Mucilaginibacter mallensis]
MKNNLDIRLYFLPLFFAMMALLPACKKSSNSGAAPIVTSIRMYHPSPKDTLLSTGNPKTDPTWAGGTGQYVVIIGQNLQNATEIDFDGVPTQFNAALFAPNSAVVQIPNIVYSTIDTTKLYTLHYKTPAGSTTFSFKLGPPAPIIMSISDVFANPGDSVYLYGANLVLVQQFTYGGTKIPKFNSSTDGTSLGFLMPATTSNKLIMVTTKSGTALDTINAKPIIAGISNCNANQGDSIYVYGSYLKTIQSFSFGGATITNFTSSPTGSYVSFVAPASSSYSSGPVTIVTSYGTASTVYNVNTQNGVTNGLLANFEWGNYFGYSWYGDISMAFSPVADFNGPLGTDNTMYIYFNSPVLAAGASKYAPLGNDNATSNPANFWMPVANLTDPPSNWAIQFEISVANPWNGGTLYIETAFAGDSYVARYEPWKNTVAFKTKGWETVTIPLSNFKSTVNQLGDGVSITQISQLLGPTGANSYNMTLKNFDTSPTTTGFYAAIDNIRCVKIK